MSRLEPGLTVVLMVLALGLVPRVRTLFGGRNVPGALGMLGLFLWSFPPVAMLHSWTLERFYPVQNLPTGEGDVIVVLSGDLNGPRPTQPQPLLDHSSFRRTMHAVWLYRNWKALPIVVSGGTIGERTETVSDTMRDLLLAYGVPQHHVWQERTSHNTHENALHTFRLLREKGFSHVVLVTDSTHMVRAELSFRKRGLLVVPAPCCFVSTAELNRFSDYVPQANAIRINEACLHEWLGLVVYYLMGKI